MTKRYPYRFKTKKEFLDEFGNRWREVVNFNWDGDMDYLCGRQLPFDEYIIQKILNGQGFLRYDGWSIGGRMITKNEIPTPSYTPRKIVRTIDEDYE